MDLGAYAQIDNLVDLVEKNDIKIPRLRGYRLMSEETPLDLEESIKGIEIYVCENLCTSLPFWRENAECWELSRWTDFLREYFIDKKANEIRWNRIHGWKRRVLKTAIHNKKKRIERQINTFNKYVGRKDVLYIHARIGGNNWAYYNGAEVAAQPWFIEKVDDAHDSTYCDIYAHINRE